MNERKKRREDFLDVADRRFACILASGETIPWNEMRGYLEDHLAGRITKRPAARKPAVRSQREAGYGMK